MSLWPNGLLAAGEHTPTDTSPKSSFETTSNNRTQAQAEDTKAPTRTSLIEGSVLPTATASPHQSPTVPVATVEDGTRPHEISDSATTEAPRASVAELVNEDNKG